MSAPLFELEHHRPGDPWPWRTPEGFRTHNHIPCLAWRTPTAWDTCWRDKGHDGPHAHPKWRGDEAYIAHLWAAA